MGMLVRKYKIDPKFHPCPPEATDAITDASKGFVGVYRVFFKSGLRLPAFDFLETVLDYYGLRITQITPSDFRKIPCFTLLCVARDVSPTINLFRHFYIPMSNGDWVSFALRHGFVELFDGLPTSIKYWKEEFFFIHASAFSSPMAYGDIADRATDPIPELSSDDQLITERLSDNFVRWVGPNEEMMGMASMSPHWNHLGKKSVEVFEGKDVTLLDRLHRRQIANSTLVMEEVLASDSPTRSESSMESALDVSRAEGSRPIPPNLRSKVVKLDSDFCKPHTVFVTPRNQTAETSEGSCDLN
ncbi:unnamed protein product [Lactuca virosa]|uniref:Transposase (putative) gypsy type domain-containing protein n=1 Tax=Lactuca virosa TaxID=75947 RepID=A0AAU9M4K6_9ASTR|nr:unnamed protein product [Lactuca virosa]